MGGKKGIQKAEREKLKKEKTKKKEKPTGKKVLPKERKVDLESIIRVGTTGLNGNKNVVIALTGIKGVSYNLSNAIVHVANIDSNLKLKEIKEGEIKKIEEIIKDLGKYNIPKWMMNRQKDYETGKDLHLTEADLMMSVRNDTNLLKKIRAYKGIRHEMGLPVRGQRTKSSFRKGLKVGVSRKKVLQAKAATKGKEDIKKKK